ncbi:MAG: trypsin-like peptidase domain-containing protein [Ktedonobacteraceae bacterium]
MPRLYTFIRNPLVEKIFLCVLAGVYVVYLVGFVGILSPFGSTPNQVAGVVEDQVDANPNSVVQYWSTANMSTVANDDEQLGNVPDFSQVDTNAGKAVQQDGQAPRDGNLSFPLSTVGKIFFSDSSGRNYVCSGTAIASTNHNMVDTAGHCLYGQGKWMQNVLFCPLYDKGIGPYDCWVARALLVPAEWMRAKPNELHRDFGMIVVNPNEQGNLTDIVGGAGWAYNQPIEQSYYAYGYPAGSPFNGETRQSCDKGSVGKSWNHAGGKVVSIPCDMTGGSSGGPWFIKSGNSWYLDGHNDFTSTIQRGHMFSPYYDDTWYALYTKAQNA